MHGESCPMQKKVERCRQAVLALLAGDAIEDVQACFGFSRSSLFAYKRRALHAMHEALKDKRCGPRHPHNRLATAQEAAVRAVCERHPTLSSYQAKDRLGSTAPSARTIQRVRKRLLLPRLKKRRVPAYKAHRFTTEQKRMIRMQIKEKLYLGPDRLAWDIQNQHHLPISPSTVKRMKQRILEEMTPQPAAPVWHFYERKHPHSLWHGDCFEKVTLTDEDRTAYQLTLLDDYSRAYV
jgi:transposase